MLCQSTPTAHLTPTVSQDTCIRVLLVDDHPAIRAGVRTLINDQPDMRVVAEARSAEEALGRLESPVHVAIIDYHLGEGPDGLWLTAQLEQIEPSPRVLVYSAFADTALAVVAPIVGADGLLGKDELAQELCYAVRRLARGQHHLPAVSPSIADVMRARLERRDQAIFGMLLHGTASKVIVERLGITPDELRARRSIILAALRPDRPASVRGSGTPEPLDYDRPKRRRSRWAA